MTVQRRFASSLQNVPGVTGSGAYSGGDLIGTLITFSNLPPQGTLQVINLADKDKQSAAINLTLFRANPGASTFTDNGAISLNAADLLNIVATIPIPAANYAAYSANSFATVKDINCPYGNLTRGANGQVQLFGVLSTTGTPTYSSTTALQLELVVEELS